MSESRNRFLENAGLFLVTEPVDELLDPTHVPTEPLWDEKKVRPAKSVHLTKELETFSSPTLHRINTHDEKVTEIERLYDSQRGIGPLVESLADGKCVVTYLYKGDEDTRLVTLDGGGTGDLGILLRFGRSNIWYRSEVVSSDAVISYTFNEDVYELTNLGEQSALVSEMTDELNPLATPNGASLVCLQSLTSYASTDPQGRLESWSCYSDHLSSNRILTFYLPVTVEPQQCKGLILFFDGEAFCLGWPEAEIGPYVPTPQILDKLITEGQIPPVASAFISAQDNRESDLVLNSQFSNAIADEFIPSILQRIGLPQLMPSRVCVAGSSYGGLCATFTSLERSDKIGNALCLSASFWVGASCYPQPPSAGPIQTMIRDNDRKPVRFYLEAGAYEGHQIVPTNYHVRDLLLAKGYDVTYHELPATHDYLHWQISLPEGLVHICKDW